MPQSGGLADRRARNFGSYHHPLATLALLAFYPLGKARLLDMRNVKWIPQIKAEINSGKPTAIVVGAGHYPGYNGLVALLEHQGYKIEQL
jgi:uncharacterized protein YbaP (TraB family)